MMRNVTASFFGALFGVGLYLSGMTDTQKVIGWLDIFGAWDPTLAFVMGGAIAPMALAWRLAKMQRTPALAASFPAPPEPKLGRKLVIGSLFFGAGWGLVGLCPGPAMASLLWGGPEGITFFVAMVIGMAIAPMAHRRLDAPLPTGDAA